MSQFSLSSLHKTPKPHLFPSNSKHTPSIVNPTTQFLSLPNKNSQLQIPSPFKLKCQHNSFSTQLINPISFPTIQKRFLISKPRNATKRCTQLLCGNSSNSLSANNKSSFRGLIETLSEAVSTAFPIWVALGCLMGLLKPDSFSWVKPQLSIWGLTITMLGMGMTLTLDDLSGAMAMPKEVIAGFLLQYSVMPLSGFFISRLLGLPSHYAAGLILVGCCPGGTASNIVTYLARANVALSVLMTAASTFSAVVMTPFLTARLAGQYVPVDATGLLMSTLQVVLLPVLAGAFFNQYFQGLVRLVSPLLPPIAVATVAVLCGNAIAQSSSAILMSGQQVVLACCLLHASGFFFGYMLARLLGIDMSSARTISIEVGMQNSVLGLVLANQHFGNPLTAVPCAVSSVCHSIIGSALAGIWRYSTPKERSQSELPLN
ncbi:hypothetical protein BVRB_4g095370 isoform A [Beta vulgaris subsp. vulgaris]|uniref:Uncharacterized protein n=1 Tax=Beta vulgaris subsp. vulgaris TaxID=3555 RepID=A0A0J8BB91_BETVV|nr:probable sodium/metabolite cotransporter BASS1, chloroplastic [Beta vulgaris subsp. vulgaris]KMS98151.1 hypothetical protein BVRB_4g095370 isoform A [Beta vulgaris subsp. vulgaris]